MQALSFQSCFSRKCRLCTSKYIIPLQLPWVVLQKDRWLVYQMHLWLNWSAKTGRWRHLLQRSEAFAKRKKTNNQAIVVRQLQLIHLNIQWYFTVITTITKCPFTCASLSSDPNAAAPSLTCSDSLDTLPTDDSAAVASTSCDDWAAATNFLVSSTRTLAFFRISSLQRNRRFLLVTMLQR